MLLSSIPDIQHIKKLESEEISSNLSRKTFFDDDNSHLFWTNLLSMDRIEMCKEVL